MERRRKRDISVYQPYSDCVCWFHAKSRFTDKPALQGEKFVAFLVGS